MQTTSDGGKSTYDQLAAKDQGKDKKRKSDEHNKGKSRRWAIIDLPGFDNLRNDSEFKAIVKRIRENQDSLGAQIKDMTLRGEIDL